MKILAECYGDTLLVKQLKFEYLPYHSGIGEVANQMRKHYENQKALAIIDADKNSPSYFKGECTQLRSKDGVVLLKHKTAHHYVIKISPAFEGFVNDAAKEAGMELFLKDAKRLREVTKDSNLHKNSSFVNYLNRLIQKNPKCITTLRSYIEEVQRVKVVITKQKVTKKRK